MYAFVPLWPVAYSTVYSILRLTDLFTAHHTGDSFALTIGGTANAANEATEQFKICNPVRSRTCCAAMLPPYKLNYENLQVAPTISIPLFPPFLILNCPTKTLDAARTSRSLPLAQEASEPKPALAAAGSQALPEN